MRRCHPASLAVGDPSGKQAGLARIGLTLASDGIAGKPCLDGIPERLRHDRLVFTRIDLIAMRDLTAVEAIGEQMIERPAAEGDSALCGPLLLGADALLLPTLHPLPPISHPHTP